MTHLLLRADEAEDCRDVERLFGVIRLSPRALVIVWPKLIYTAFFFLLMELFMPRLLCMTKLDFFWNILAS